MGGLGPPPLPSPRFLRLWKCLKLTSPSSEREKNRAKKIAMLNDDSWILRVVRLLPSHCVFKIGSYLPSRRDVIAILHVNKICYFDHKQHIIGMTNCRSWHLIQKWVIRLNHKDVSFVNMGLWKLCNYELIHNNYRPQLVRKLIIVFWTYLPNVGPLRVLLYKSSHWGHCSWVSTAAGDMYI